MAKGHSGNAFSTDFTSMFNGIAPSNSKKDEKKESKESDTPAKKSVTTVTKDEKPPKAAPKKVSELTPTSKAAEVKATNKTEDIKPIEPSKDAEKIINPKSKKAAANGEVYQTISLTSTDTRDYLKYRAKELGLKTSEFFWQIVEQDIERIKKKEIDAADEEHQLIKQATLGCSSTLKLSEENRQLLVKCSIRHKLSLQRYIAFIVKQAMDNDDEWF